MEVVIYDFMIPFTVAVVIQLTKLLIDFFTIKRLKRHHIFTAGWFPSVHSGLTASVATLVYLREGPESVLFAVTIALMLLISYDAMNVRYEAWRHAYYLNHIKFELKDILRSKGDQGPELKERIGHTPIEVVGWLIIGCVLTVLFVKYMLVW
jgi:acid phosphatase family membrane protein YuiD